MYEFNFIKLFKTPKPHNRKFEYSTEISINRQIKVEKIIKSINQQEVK